MLTDSMSAEGPRLHADTYYLLNILKAYEAHSSNIGTPERFALGHFKLELCHPTPNRP